MRDPTTTSYLPTLLSVRGELYTAVSKIAAYEALCSRMEWGPEDTSGKQGKAFAEISARVLSAAMRLDLIPQEREKLMDLLRQERIRNEGLARTNERLREANKHLEAALVRLTAERAA